MSDPSESPAELLNSSIDQRDEKPIRCAKFRQQELWAWKPVWSPMVVVTMYLIVSAIFIPVGVIVLIQSSNLYSSPRLRYDNFKGCLEDQRSETCTIDFIVDKNITKPSYFYYGLVNFYQNARTYVTSRSAEQLRGSSTSTGSCDPLEFDQNGQVLVPCGLTANSQFNDSFELCRTNVSEPNGGLSNCNSVNLSKDGIAWNIDRTTRFIGSDNFTTEQNLRIRSEDFMVWMRLSAYRSWKKLYRIIDEDMPAGTYHVNIDSQFPVDEFNGQKFFFISETTWFGGPNEPLGIAYIVVGSLTLVLAIGFFVRSRVVTDLHLPPETTVYLEGLVKHPVQPRQTTIETGAV